MQERLFDGGVEAMLFHTHHVPGQGWQLTVRRRREGELWDAGYWCRYSRLSRAELLDVLIEEASAQ